MRYLDLFAGAGGLSEGFKLSGFYPVAHIEMDKAACFTLQTRSAYHWLNEHDMLDVYHDYLTGKIDRNSFTIFHIPASKPSVSSLSTV